MKCGARNSLNERFNGRLQCMTFASIHLSNFDVQQGITVIIQPSDSLSGIISQNINERTVPALNAYLSYMASQLQLNSTHQVNDPVSNVYTTNESMISFMLKESDEAQIIENIM